MGTLLFYITLVVVLIVVLALVVYLLGIIIALRNANRNLVQLAGGLSQVMRDTEPLPLKLGIVNDALSQLLTGLLSVDGHLAAIVKVLGR